MEEHESTLPAPAVLAGTAFATIAGVGLVGAIFGWARGSNLASAMAIAYYFAGSIVFLVGSFPSGGFSLLRGRSRRRPMGAGSFAAPSMLLGAALIGLGVLLDVARPF